MRVHDFYMSGKKGPESKLTKLLLVTTEGAEITITPTDDGTGLNIAVGGEFDVELAGHADLHTTWGATIKTKRRLKTSRAGLPR